MEVTVLKTEDLQKLEKEYYKNSLDKAIVNRSKLLDNIVKSMTIPSSKKIFYFPKASELKKKIRPKRQPKRTVKLFALMYTSSDYYANEELIDLTFSKEEADDWKKQDNEHSVKVFYVKELKK